MLLKLVLLIFLLFSNIVFANPKLPGKIIFAVQPHDARKYENGQLENNIVIRLAKALNVEVELYECPWARCMQAINTGKADVIDDLFIGEKRQQFIYFLQPPFDHQTAGFRFFADNTKVPIIKKWDDLLTLNIGVLRGYQHFPKFDQASYLNKVDVLTIQAIENLILKGRIDVFIAPPSFDEDSFKGKNAKSKLSLQPFSHIEKLPLFVGISRQSNWFKHRELLVARLERLVGSDNKSAK